MWGVFRNDVRAVRNGFRGRTTSEWIGVFVADVPVPRLGRIGPGFRRSPKHVDHQANERSLLLGIGRNGE